MRAVRWPRYISRRLCAAGLARRAMGIAAKICVYTNGELTVESL